jgi:hypothetical protein
MGSHRWIFGILLTAFCASLLMAALTTAKRIAVERPSPSLKLRQSGSVGIVWRIDGTEGAA